MSRLSPRQSQSTWVNELNFGCSLEVFLEEILMQIKLLSSKTLYAFFVARTGACIIRLHSHGINGPSRERSKTVAFISLTSTMIGCAHSTPPGNHFTPSRAGHTNDTSSLPVGPYGASLIAIEAESKRESRRRGQYPNRAILCSSPRRR